MARPKCPRHPNSRVWFDGTYGAPGRRRQRFRCLPGNGERWHRFTEQLPRQAVDGDGVECLTCERVPARHEGPQSPRHFHYTTRELLVLSSSSEEARPTGERQGSPDRATRTRTFSASRAARTL